MSYLPVVLYVVWTVGGLAAILYISARLHRRRIARILVRLGEGERSSRELRDEFGGMIYGDLRSLEDDGVIECRTEPGGPERGYRDRYIYRRVHGGSGD